MKLAPLLLLLLACAVTATAQDLTSTNSIASAPAQSLTKGTWDFGVLFGGGPGLGYAKDTHFVYSGGRVGLILTKDHGEGRGRGNFEWAVEMLPLYTVVTPAGSVYGGSFKPAVWRWNFVSGEKIAPYVSAAGGILFSTRNLPAGNTSWVNFTPEAAAGRQRVSEAGPRFARGRRLRPPLKRRPQLLQPRLQRLPFLHHRLHLVQARRVAGQSPCGEGNPRQCRRGAS